MEKNNIDSKRSIFDLIYVERASALLASFENPAPDEEEEIATIDKFIKKYSHTYTFDSDEFIKIMILNIDCRVLNVTNRQVTT